MDSQTPRSNLAHEAGVLDAQTAIKTAEQLLDEFAAKHAAPKPTKRVKNSKLPYLRKSIVTSTETKKPRRSGLLITEAALLDQIQPANYNEYGGQQ